MKQGGRSVPGFLTVRGAAQGLRLAPRSVRDLIYAGRLPSVRLGRLHYVSAADVELERRRRLQLPPPAPRRPRQQRRTRLAVVPTTARRTPSQSADVARQARAAQREALRQQWLRAGRQSATPALPFRVDSALAPAECAGCARALPAGARLVVASAPGGDSLLCLTCGRRALLSWADERRRESSTARRFAQDLGQPAGQPAVGAVA